MALRIQRNFKALPDSLRVHGSDLDVLIDTIEEAGERKFVGFQQSIRQVQRTVAGLCKHYEPSQQPNHDFHCRSGEVNGRPFRGAICHDCRVSQFSQSGYFTGEILGPDVVHQVIEPGLA